MERVGTDHVGGRMTHWIILQTSVVTHILSSITVEPVRKQAMFM
jgi:hypothetical protein